MKINVMTVERVYRIKGTLLLGTLECDVRIGDKLTICSHVTILLGIETFGKTHESAVAGEKVILYFRGISEVDIPVGTVVTK